MTAGSWLRQVIGETKVLDLLPLAVYICQAPHGTIQYYNEHAVRLWGRRPSRGDTHRLLCGSSPMANALETGASVRDEEVIVQRPDGSRAIVLVNIDPLRASDGAVIGAVGVLRDITEQKRTEEAQFRLAAIVESCDDAIISKDLDGVITSWNEGAERIFGYTAAEAIGRPVSMLTAPDRLNEMPTILNQVRRGQPVEHYDTLRRRKDGEPIHVSLTVSPVKDHHGRIIGASKIARDITGRKREEEERARLLAQEREARTIAELLNRVGPALAAELDPEKLVQFVIEIGTALVGAEHGWFSHKADLPAAASRGIVRYDDLLRDEECCRRVLTSAMQDGHGSVRSYLAAPVVSRSGELLGVFAFGHTAPGKFTEDHERILAGISAQAAIAMDNARLLDQAQWVQNELARSNEELRRANQDLETFAYSASHDLKEPLRTVALSAQILQRVSGDTLQGESLRFLEGILQGTCRMESLIQDLLNYTTVTKVAEGAAARIDAGSVLETVLENLMGRLEQTGGEVTFDRLPAVDIHEIRLAQLFQNLIGNALKYRSERPPHVHITAEEGDGWTVFSVSDNGIGIEAEYADKIFGLFKRLHSQEHYPGSGIGLAICRRIVEQYGGRIWLAQSVPGEGSTFSFAIPARGAALQTRTPVC